MNKKIFSLLVIIMAIAVAGIIAVQIFWINSSKRIHEQQFNSNVKSALIDVSKSIQDREFREYDKKFRPVMSQMKSSGTTEIKEFFYKRIDTVNNAIFTYKQSVLETDFKSPRVFFKGDTNKLGLNFKSYFAKKEKEVSSLKFNTKSDFKNSKKTLREVKIGEMSNLQKLEFENFFKEIAPRTPIYKRVSNTEINLNIINKLNSRGVETPFQFAVFDDGFPTKIKSADFKKAVNSYAVPLFVKDDGKTNYVLHVIFPEKKYYILSNIKKILLLSLFFVLFIIMAFGSAIYQIIKQKKISEIKTDFINNMTHEFKTPIATINLALDAIRNPKIINDNAKVLQYVKMIRQENKRMHAQVENVLQISKLEKNQLDISKEVVDIHDIIEDAITHLSLIVNNEGGYIKTHFEAIQTEMSASELHLTNVIVNILDNAVKYNADKPKIDIYTENAGNFVLIKIKDNGIGMNKIVQKNIFDKFYREQKGNIHNVKGHGLGLSYVKKIVENHRGTIYVESTLGKGSTFFIKLPIV